MREAAGITDVLVSDKDIDVLTDLTLLICDAVADSAVLSPQRSECVAHSFA